jgi:peroxiredoxin
MTKSTQYFLVALLVLAGAVGIVYGLSLGSAPSDSSPAAAPAPATTGPPRGASATTGASGPDAPAAAPSAESRPSTRKGRVLKLDDAIRELDLIRPSRHKIAEDFSLRTPDGGHFRLADHRGKVVLVNFWATWCPPCREEMPAMERLYRHHRDHGLVLVAVSLDADPALVPPYVSTSKLTFPIALDPKADIGNKYGVRALPSSFVIGRDGTMVALALGPRAWDNDASHSLVEALASDGASRAATR